MEEIQYIKLLIDRNNLEAIKDHLEHLLQTYEISDWTVLYKDCYLHACLKKRKEIAEWFVEMFNHIDPIQQIALRQVFSYGKYLLNK